MDAGAIQDHLELTQFYSARPALVMNVKKDGRNAAMANVGGVFRVRDVSDRREFGTSDRANRSESNSFTISRDLMADPYFLAMVADHNGMSPMRFMNQSEERIIQMVQDYVSEKGMAQQATTMPQQTFSGEKLPTKKGALVQQSAMDRASLPKDIQSIHKRKVAQTGYGGTTALKVDTSAPSIISASSGDVQGQLDPKNKESIPARSGALDENVSAWASPDKAVGAGRANPAAVNKDNMIRDGKDALQKALDRVTGGDGTADGEKLNDNMKRETAASVQITNGSK